MNPKISFQKLFHWTLASWDISACSKVKTVYHSCIWEDQNNVLALEVKIPSGIEGSCRKEIYFYLL